MNKKPILYIYEQINHYIGNEIFVESSSTNINSVVFEDDGKTGYFYAVNQESDSKIVDALHIYDVDCIVDKSELSTFRILWSEDETKAFLSINGYYHAVFDFQNKAGYCRNGFPEYNQNWNYVTVRLLTDELIEEFSAEN